MRLITAFYFLSHFHILIFSLRFSESSLCLFLLGHALVSAILPMAGWGCRWTSNLFGVA
jgi:hypothetical protein